MRDLREHQPDESEIAPGEPRLGLIFTMAEFYKSIGCYDVRARVETYRAPATYVGERPDVVARHAYRGIVCDVVTEAELARPMRFRLKALADYAYAWSAEYHLACLGEHADRVRARCAMAGVRAFIWGL